MSPNIQTNFKYLFSNFFNTRKFFATAIILSTLVQLLSILSFLPANSVKTEAATTCSNRISNGAFTTDLTGWTATSGWIWNNGTAALATDTLTNQTISQSITGYSNTGGTTTFTIELQPAEANNLTTFGAIMDISFGGTKYLTIDNPIGTGNVTYTAANGATFTASTVVRNALATIVLTVPSTVTTPKSLEFKHVSGDDDWYIYNVATDVCVTATDDNYTTTGVTPVTLTPLTGDTAVTTIKSIDGNILIPGTVQNFIVEGGFVNISAAGLIKFTPNAGFTGDSIFPYVIQDTAGNTATANEKVTVSAPTSICPLILKAIDWTLLNATPNAVSSPTGQTFTNVGPTLGIPALNGVDIILKYVFDGTGTNDIRINGFNKAGTATPSQVGPGYYIWDGTATMTLSAPFVLSANGSAGINGGETNSWGPAALGSIAPVPTAAGLVVTDDSIFNSTGVSISMASPQWKTTAPTTTITTTVDAGNGISTIFEVYITNCPPVAIDDTYTTTGTTPVTLNPLIGDSDPDVGDVIKIYSINGTPLTPGTAQVITITGKGVVNIDAAGVIKFTPNTGFIGTANIPYVIQDINGNQASAVEKITVTTVPLGQLELLKIATLNGTGAVGDTITYKFTVKNTGSVDLTTVTISDTKCSPVAGTLATLAVGATDTTTFSCIYTLTQVDITAGKVENQATVTGKAPNGTDVTDLSDNNNPAQTGPDDITVTLLFPFIRDPSISLDKNSTLQDINGNGYSDLGDKIKYTFVIKNTGNVPLSNVSVTDDKCSPVVGVTIALLAVGEVDSTTFSCTYSLTQSDLDNGKVINQATVTGTPPNYPNGNPSSPITKKSNDPKTLIPQDATITKLVNYQDSLVLIRTGGSSDVFNFKLINISILIIAGSLFAMLVRRSLKHPR
jgi:hypothetical protein